MMGQLAKLPGPARNQYKDRLAFDRLVKGLLYAMHDQLPSFGARELSSVLWALAKLQQPPSAALLRTMMEGLLAKLGSCNALDLSLVLWALATLELSPEPHWMEALLEEAAAKLHGATPQAVANVGHALAVLEYNPGGAWLGQFERHAARVLPESSGQGTAGLVWCFAALKHRPSGAWVSEFLEVTSERMPAFEAGSCARIFFSLASLGVRRPARPPAFSAPAFRAAAGESACCSTRRWVPPTAGGSWRRASAWRGAAPVAPSLAPAQVEVPDRWLGALGEALGPQLRALSPQDCAYLLWALAQLPEEQQQSEQQEALLDALLARSQDSLRQYDPWQLAHVGWSLGRMGARRGPACL